MSVARSFFVTQPTKRNLDDQVHDQDSLQATVKQNPKLEEQGNKAPIETTFAT